MPESHKTPRAAVAASDDCSEAFSHSADGACRNLGADRRSDTDLLDYVFNYRGEVPDAVMGARKYALDLGLGKPGEYRGFNWTIRSHKYDSFGITTPIPPKFDHSGQFEWIGQARDGVPQYLWDAHKWRTVEATHDRLQRYVAVSWTWGRYQVRDHKGNKSWRKTTGVRWRVPRLDHVPSEFSHKTSLDRLTHLKHILANIKTFRYFWVDVLCIDQGSDSVARRERKQEIAKQAHIFDKATASIAYLWTLDEDNKHELSKALRTFGAILHTTINFKSNQAVFEGESLPPLYHHTEWEDPLDKLKADNWFTSLWALQEIVLFPSALWMTREGHICSINGTSVTTRLVATCVRLLLAVREIRRFHWDQAENRYMSTNSISLSRFESLKREMSKSEHDCQLALLDAIKDVQAMQDAGGAQTVQGAQDVHDKSGIADPSLVIERPATPQIPSIIRNRRADRLLEKAIERWKQWSLGTSGIDISLHATRTAILVAGNNREFVDNQSKEYALLAALKISHHEGLITDNMLKTDGNYFSHKLLNFIMHAEKTLLFDVIHYSFVAPFVCQSKNPIDVSEWQQFDTSIDYLDVEVSNQSVVRRRGSSDPVVEDWTKITKASGQLTTSVQYLRKGVNEFTSVLPTKEATLTDMLACSAHRVSDVKLPHQHKNLLQPEDLAGWHIHRAGMVHIPKTARIQEITKKINGTRLELHTNGPSQRYIVEILSDFKHILRSQSWLWEYLGGQPQFLFLPLYTLKSPDRKLVTQSRLMSLSFVDVQKEVVCGVVLVGKNSLRCPSSTTCYWYKLGTYQGEGPLKTIDRRTGIMVTSPYAEIEAQQRVATKDDSCDFLLTLPKLMVDSFEESEEGYDMVNARDVLHNSTHESMASSVAPSL